MAWSDVLGTDLNRIALMVLLLGLAVPASAELYRWTDADGRVHYSDQPPPASIKKLQRLRSQGPNRAADPAPSRPTVLLYTADCGATCDQAADYLRKRGVPFSLKNIQRDAELAEELKKRTGTQEIPILFVGDAMQRGYSPTVWDKMLEVAGYPNRPEKTATQPASQAGAE